MDVRIQVFLEDIHQAISEIADFLPDDLEFDIYRADLKTKKAVERNLEIIGEAINRILKLDQHFPISNARKIVDTRNRIIHGYDNISDEVIWAIIVKELPQLEKEVLEFLK